MQKVPYDIWSHYDAFLKAKVKDVSQHEALKKWFLYFWDFRAQYHPPDSRSEQVRLFIEKLQEKNNHRHSKNRRHVPSRFISRPASPFVKGKHPTPDQKQAHTPGMPRHVPEPAARLRNESRYNEWRYLGKSSSPAWDKVVSDLSNEIKTRHYSRKTLKAYGDWIRKFQGFLHDKLPEELSEADEDLINGH